MNHTSRPTWVLTPLYLPLFSFSTLLSTFSRLPRLWMLSSLSEILSSPQSFRNLWYFNEGNLFFFAYTVYFFHECLLFQISLKEDLCLLVWFHFDISDVAVTLPFPWLQFLNQSDIKHDWGYIKIMTPARDLVLMGISLNLTMFILQLFEFTFTLFSSQRTTSQIHQMPNDFVPWNWISFCRQIHACRRKKTCCHCRGASLLRPGLTVKSITKTEDSVYLAVSEMPVEWVLRSVCCLWVCFVRYRLRFLLFSLSEHPATARPAGDPDCIDSAPWMLLIVNRFSVDPNLIGMSLTLKHVEMVFKTNHCIRIITLRGYMSGSCI